MNSVFRLVNAFLCCWFWCYYVSGSSGTIMWVAVQEQQMGHSASFHLLKGILFIEWRSSGWGWQQDLPAGCFVIMCQKWMNVDFSESVSSLKWLIGNRLELTVHTEIIHDQMSILLTVMTKNSTLIGSKQHIKIGCFSFWVNKVLCSHLVLHPLIGFPSGSFTSAYQSFLKCSSLHNEPLLVLLSTHSKSNLFFGVLLITKLFYATFASSSCCWTECLPMPL